MAQRINIPGQGVVEFPDGMSDADIVKAIQANTPSQTPAKPVNALDSLAMGVTDPIHGGAQLLTHILPDSVVNAGNKFNNWLADKTGLVAKVPAGGVDQMVQQREADYQAGRQAAARGVSSLVTGKPADPGFDWWRLAGNVISPVNKAIPIAGPSASLGAKVATGMAGGVASAGLTPTTGDNYWDQKKGQALTGAAFGGVTPIVVSSAARLVSPKASVNPDIQTLTKAGVQPTIGQTLGGPWNAAEEKLQSVPVLGDFIANARGNSIKQFNNAAINRASGKVGQSVDGVGQDAVAKAGDVLSNAYDSAKNQIGHFQIDQQGAQELGNLRQMVQSLQPREQSVFNDAWQKLSSEVSPNGSITADGFKRLDSFLGKQSGRFSGSNDAYQQQVGDALQELQRIVNDNAMRANPNAASLKNAADSGWANLVRVEGAAKAAKNNGGVFTPAQLNGAIQQADQSVRGRAVARGTALMQDLANAGQNVIGNKIPDSGTAGRYMLGGGTLTGGWLVNPAIPLGLLGTGLAYTQPIQGLLTRAITSRPEGAQTVANALRKASPTLGLLGSQVGLNLAR